MKYVGLFLHSRLIQLLNTCWSDYEIPDEWRTTKVLYLFMKGEGNETENYRVISLLNTVYDEYSKL